MKISYYLDQALDSNFATFNYYLKLSADPLPEGPEFRL